MSDLDLLLIFVYGGGVGWILGQLQGIKKAEKLMENEIDQADKLAKAARIGLFYLIHDKDTRPLYYSEPFWLNDRIFLVKKLLDECNITHSTQDLNSANKNWSSEKEYKAAKERAKNEV